PSREDEGGNKLWHIQARNAARGYQTAATKKHHHEKLLELENSYVPS
ncbi:hypothetical protein A2U01_0060763, partial [Trifolium medium]|nr:hypothetical protein [Trifolium medium]